MRLRDLMNWVHAVYAVKKLETNGRAEKFWITEEEKQFNQDYEVASSPK